MGWAPCRLSQLRHWPELGPPPGAERKFLLPQERPRSGKEVDSSPGPTSDRGRIVAVGRRGLPPPPAEPETPPRAPHSPPRIHPRRQLLPRRTFLLGSQPHLPCISLPRCVYVQSLACWLCRHSAWGRPGS